MSFEMLALQHGRWAMGVLGWSPTDFWAATPRDVALAWRGWCQVHGIADGTAACDRSTFEALLSLFPD